MPGDQTEPGVAVGAMLYTLVDPTNGHEVAYNRWYERDHFYAGCMVGPWLFAGRRWVATRELKDLRFPVESGVAKPTDAGSYLATYWVHAGHEAEHFDWANKQVFELYADGRGFDERVHAHTALYMHKGDQFRATDTDPVPVALALDHPYQGLVSVHVDRADGVSHADFEAWFAAEAAAGLLAGPVASVAFWRPIIPRGADAKEAPMDLGSGPGTLARTMQVFFLEAGPSEVWDRFVAYGEQVDASGVATVALAAPFIPTIPGTDTYTDQLW